MAEQEELEVTGPGGLKAAFKGQQTMGVIMLLVLASVVGLMLWQHDANSKESMTQVAKAQQEVKDALKDNRDTTEAMIYVLTLPQAERERLNLSKPRKLLEMTR